METNIPTLRKGIFYLEHIYYLLHSFGNDNLDKKAVSVKNTAYSSRCSKHKGYRLWQKS